MFFRQWIRLVWLFLGYFRVGVSLSRFCLCRCFPSVGERGGGWGGRECGEGERLLLAQDIQVDWGGFSHGEQDLLDVLNVQSLLRFPLPAAQHDVVNLLGTDPWSLQYPTLGYALDNLRRRERDSSGVREAVLTVWLLCFLPNEKAVTPGGPSVEI